MKRCIFTKNLQNLTGTKMKPNLQRLIEEGFKQCSEYSPNCKLYKKDNERVIFNITNDFEAYRYDVRHPFSKE